MKTYYERIRGLREDRDLTQQDIANILKTTQQVYSRYENGTNEIPLHHVITLCNFFKVSADYILGLNDNPNWLYNKCWGCPSRAYKEKLKIKQKK